MGLEQRRREELKLAAQVHAIGKISVPTEILANPGVLSTAEFEIIETHAARGGHILSVVDFPWPLAQIVEQHHEKYDGTGYNVGLSGDEILLEASILCVADVVEAMSSHRPYRAALGLDSYIPGRLYRSKEPPLCFKKHYDLYITECTNRGLSDRTVASRVAYVCSLLLHAKNRNIASVAELDQEFLDEYLHICSGKMPGAMPRVLSAVRCFLRSMFLNGFIQKDLSLFIPSASRYPTKPVQKLWTREEITLLLGCVDRSDSKGKRDYALILLMVRYGMRVGDILNLKLTDLDWESVAICFRQEKTSVINSLPILDGVGWALADWITNTRPRGIRLLSTTWCGGVGKAKTLTLCCLTYLLTWAMRTCRHGTLP